MRVVLDTGVLIAALITSDTPPDLIYQAWRKRRFQLVTSEWQLAEFRRVSRYRKLRPFLKPSEAGNMVNGLRQHAIVIKELPDVELSSDPNDNGVLATAVASEADYLVTGDKRGLLVLERVERTRIVTARQFLKTLARRKSP
ncbi:MAG: putative toxin-antitoxin system toxin component, PIN family [Acidiferrobacterales bacterium]